MSETGSPAGEYEADIQWNNLNESLKSISLVCKRNYKERKNEATTKSRGNRNQDIQYLINEMLAFKCVIFICIFSSIRYPSGSAWYHWSPSEALLRISHTAVFIFVPQNMQRHAVGEEGIKIRSQTHRCFCFKGKQWNCIDQTVVVLLLMLLMLREIQLQ